MYRQWNSSLKSLNAWFRKDQFWIPLEYAFDVWVRCSLSNAEKLEQVQLLDARIFSGLPIFASKTFLYYEIGLTPYLHRKHKHAFLYKIYLYE